MRWRGHRDIRRAVTLPGVLSRVCATNSYRSRCGRRSDR